MRTADVTTAQLGWLLLQDVRSKDGKRLFRKGAVLGPAALERWPDVEAAVIHVLELEAGDLHEDVAGQRIAAAVAGEGILAKGPIQSRYNLIAAHKGLLRVDPERLKQINRIEGVTVFSLLDRQTVLPAKVVAGVKVTPSAIPEARVIEVEQLCRAADQPPLAVLPFAPKRAAVVATEGLNERMRARFRETVARKLHWYGSTVTEVRFVDSEPEAVAAAWRDFLSDGVDILMAAGGNTIDPLDPIFQALPLVGGQMVHFGAPAHPGSMFWLARVGNVPIFNLASCSMYSSATVADLILPLVMTGQHVTSDDIIELGYGGLLEREMAFRFPDYAAEASDEADADES